MALRDDVKKLVKFYKENEERLAHNKILFDILEGDLLKYVLLDLQKELSERSFEQVKGRVAPINILKRMIDKLSKIYAKPPKRTPMISNKPAENQKDKDLFDFYVTKYDLNTNGSVANEFFNLFKYLAWEPYLDEGVPCMRIIPADRFLTYSDNQVSPLKPTHFIKVMGKVKDIDKAGNGQEKTILYLYTDTEFLIVDEYEKIRTDLMVQVGNPDGINVYGKIPFVYTSRSRHELMPKMDTDTLAMSKIIPILLSDLNYAVKFQSFSIVYGINVDEEDIKMAPNAFWRLKSDSSDGSGAPSVGTIKPQVDIDQVFRLIQGELAFWFNSRNIKPGTIGDIGGQNLASGFAKMIDEMDTSEDRQKQVPFFIDAEQKIFDLTFNYLHPVWIRDPQFTMKMAVSKGLDVSTEFAEQLPLMDETTIIANEIQKLSVALSTRKMSLKRLYPDFSEQEIDDLMAEIDKENQVIVPTVNPLQAGVTAIPNDNLTSGGGPNVPGAPGTTGAATPDNPLPGGSLIDVTAAATSTGTFTGPTGS